MVVVLLLFALRYRSLTSAGEWFRRATRRFYLNVELLSGS